MNFIKILGGIFANLDMVEEMDLRSNAGHFEIKLYYSGITQDDKSNSSTIAFRRLNKDEAKHRLRSISKAVPLSEIIDNVIPYLITEEAEAIRQIIDELEGEQ
jgi:DNA polymerase III delta prime subunit